MAQKNKYNFSTEALAEAVDMEVAEVERILAITETKEVSVRAIFHQGCIRLTRHGKELLEYLKSEDMKDYDYGKGLILLEIGNRFGVGKNTECCS